MKKYNDQGVNMSYDLEKLTINKLYNHTMKRKIEKKQR